MNNKSNEKSSMVLKAAFAMLAAGLPMQYASANGNVAPICIQGKENSWQMVQYGYTGRSSDISLARC